jgi:uncharacterized membrane protein
MSVIKLLLAFAPWIVFGLIAGQSFFSLEIAIIVCIAITLLLGYKQMKKGYYLTWVTFIFFILSFITAVLMKNMWVASHLSVLSFMTLAAVTWGSLLIGEPFTLQYAKEDVERSLWDNKSFIHTNQVITAFWGVIFLINLGINYYKLNHQEVVGWAFLAANWILIIMGLVFTMEYTKIARKRRLEKEKKL